MAKFFLTLQRPYGYLSLEGEDEKDISENIARLTKLGKLMDERFGVDVEIPAELVKRAAKLKNVEKVLVALSIANRPLERREYVGLAKKLGVPVGWWDGSNFYRDLKGLPANMVEKVPSGKKGWKLTLTRRGSSFVRSMMRARLNDPYVKNEGENTG